MSTISEMLSNQTVEFAPLTLQMVGQDKWRYLLTYRLFAGDRSFKGVILQLWLSDNGPRAWQ